jgi:hypothetical protein
LTEKQQQLKNSNLSSTILYSMLKLGINSSIEELRDFEVDLINSYIAGHIPDKGAEEDVAVYMEHMLGLWKKTKKGL